MANPFEFTPADPIGTLEEHRQRIAQTASLEADAAARKDNLASQQDFRAAMKTISPNLPVMEQLGQIASAAVTTGRFSEAEKTIQVMSTLENRDSMEEQRKARAIQANATAAKSRMERLLALYSGVSDPSSKALADDVYAREFGMPSPWAGQPYSPQMVKLAKESQVKQLDSVTEALRVAQTATIAADDARQSLVAGAQLRYYNARVAAVQEKINQNKKSSGKLAEPKPNEVRAVEAKILHDYPDLEAAEFDLAVREIAADAKEIQLQKHGSFTDAMDEALQARSGQFTRLPGLKIPGLNIEVRRGKQKYTPLPQGIPPGSKVVGRTPDGRNVWKAPNGKQYAESAASGSDDEE